MTRPKTRTAQLDAALKTEIRQRFGTLKNAYAVLINPLAMAQDVFTRVAAGRPSLPAEVQAVKAALAQWKATYIK